MSRAPNGVYALRYATRSASVRGEHFYGHPDGCMEPWPIHYYVWVILAEDSVTVIDTGFTSDEAERRGSRTYEASPLERLWAIGVAPADVDRVVLTHLHYDHTGFAEAFPTATVFLQRTELDFWMSPLSKRSSFAHLVLPQDIEAIQRINDSGRLVLLDGDLDLDATVSVHHVGGHTPGMQVVRVQRHDAHNASNSSHIGADAIVLASDASHFYANFEQDQPYGVVHNLPLMHQAFDRLRELAGEFGTIVPGHDPQVAERHGTLAGFSGTIIDLTSPQAGFG